MDEHGTVPTGRLRRLGRMVGLTTRVGSGLIAGGAKRLLGSSEDPRIEAARKVLATLGEMKGAALKFGQMASLSADVLPPEARAIAAKMFGQAQTLPFADIAAVVRAELGAEPAALFAEFDEQPAAAASLAQVHRARLHSGELVAVKVQYPGVGAALRDDLRNVGAIVAAVGLGGALFDAREHLDELRTAMLGELDYRHELESLEAFRALLAPWPDLVVPRAVPALCTERVLVLEWLEGPTLATYGTAARDASAPAGDAAARFALGEQVVRAVLGPFLRSGVVHGDAHPGNFVVMSGGRLGVLDFGSIKRMPEASWRRYRAVIAALVRGEGRGDALGLLRDAGFELPASVERVGPMLQGLLDAIAAPLQGPYDFGADTMMPALFALKQKYPVASMQARPPAEGLLFFRALAGVAHNLRSLRASGDLRPTLTALLTA